MRGGGRRRARHLAAAGDREVVLLERHTVASGTTWHLVGALHQPADGHVNPAWAAAACGVDVALHAAEHVHVRSGPVAGIGPDLPVLRELDGSFYVRAEADRAAQGSGGRSPSG